ncbi:MAG: hypothetical protein ACHP9T_05015 [Caulobacterales bacterium]|jgi:hypothetical protein
MPVVLILATALHVLSAVFWAGSTFALARTGGSGAAQLFRPQMGAAGVAVLTGAYLWSRLHRSFGAPEQILLIGGLCALVAAAVQGALIRPIVHAAGDGVALAPRVLIGQRVASALLAVTLICMVVSRYV